MTLSVLKYIDEPISFRGIRCYADSLITAADTGSSLTTHAIKILPVELKSQPYTYKEDAIQTATIGFTFAGNLNVAILTYNLLTILCSNIQRSPAPQSYLPPAIINISTLCAQILYNYNKSYGEINGYYANAEIVLFGYCFKEKNFKAFHLYPDSHSGEFHINIKDVDICNVDYYAIGTGKALLNQKVQNNKGVFSHNLVKEIIEDRESFAKGVGGFYQRAWAQQGIIRLYSAPTDDHTGLPFSFCGFNTLIPLGQEHIICLPMHCSEA